jgi:hypothetical protein
MLELRSDVWLNKTLVRVVGILTLCIGCEELPTLPTAPSELVTGIVVYEHANFGGASAHITADIADLDHFDGPCEHSAGDDGYFFDWNDCISSVRVAPGWSATLYRASDYRDDSITVTADVPDLARVAHDCSEGGLNDCVTSIRVQRR